MFRFISTMVTLVLLTLAGCASTTPDPQDGNKSYGVIIAESWEQKVNLKPSGFVDDIDNKGKKFGKAGAKAGGVVGCVSGAVALAIVVPGPGAIEVGCVAGGAVVAVPSFILGYGIGALAGTFEATAKMALEGSKGFASETEEPIDIAPLIAVFNKSDPAAALKLALDGSAQEGVGIPKFSFVTESFVVEDQPFAYFHGVPKRIRLKDGDARNIGDAGNSHILVLLIHRFDVTTTGMANPVSRLNVLVSGELRSSKNNKRLKSWIWTYQSNPVKPQKIADENANLLRVEIARGWNFIAQKVISDVRS